MLKCSVGLGVAVALAITGCGGSTRTVTTTTTPQSASQTTSAQASAGPTTSTIAGGMVCTYAPDGAIETCSQTDGSASAAASVGTPGPPVALGHTVSVIGESVVGQPPDAELNVKVTSVSPIPNSDYSGELPPNQAADAVNMVITNTGSQPFTDDLASDVQLLSASGQTGSPDLLPPATGPCAQNVNSSSPNLGPGQTLHVCVPVTPPQGARVARVRFTPDAGLSMDYGEWLIR